MQPHALAEDCRTAKTGLSSSYEGAPMNRDFLKAILILPGTALVYVPVLILWLTRNSFFAGSFSPGSALAWLGGLILAGSGLVLMIWTMILFAKQGRGTPAPWQPISKFIVSGPYAHMRNPMLTGVILFQGAESLLMQSWGLFVWMLVFFVLNTLYFKFSEEPQLEQRYGAAYMRYLAHVPRWLPRLAPYQGMD